MKKGTGAFNLDFPGGFFTPPRMPGRDPLPRKASSSSSSTTGQVSWLAGRPTISSLPGPHGRPVDKSWKFRRRLQLRGSPRLSPPAARDGLEGTSLQKGSPEIIMPCLGGYGIPSWPLYEGDQVVFVSGKFQRQANRFFRGQSSQLFQVPRNRPPCTCPPWQARLTHNTPAGRPAGIWPPRAPSSRWASA